MPIIFARDAEAGRRYRCVDQGEFFGDIIEICARPSDLRNGKLVPLTTRDGSFIHINAVGDGGRRIREADPARPLCIPAFYKLEPYDAPFVKAPKVRKPQAAENIKRGRSGGATKEPRLWRGWAHAARHDMERLVEVIEAEGFWAALRPHYYSVGFRAEVCMVVYRAGQLGFPSKPDGPLGQLPTRKPTTDPYMPWRIALGTVMAAEKWDEMLDMLRRHLREFKRAAERRR